MRSACTVHGRFGTSRAQQTVVEPHRPGHRHRQAGRAVLDERPERLGNRALIERGDLVGRADHLAGGVGGQRDGQHPVPVRGGERPIRPAGIDGAHLDAVHALVAELHRLDDHGRHGRVTEVGGRGAPVALGPVRQVEHVHQAGYCRSSRLIRAVMSVGVMYASMKSFW